MEKWIFDSIGKKVSEVGKRTVAKTKEFADTARLQSLISEEERKIDGIYMQIGKQYVSIHRKDYEENFKSMVIAVFEAEEKIGDYRQQIQKSKGVQICKKCGAEVPGESVFCSSCGAKMPEKQELAHEHRIKCSKCGADAKEGMRFCIACGSEIVIETSEDADKESAVKDARSEDVDF